MHTNASSAEHKARVHRAEVIVSVQADCTTDEALHKMKERANELGLTLDDTATDVLRHLIWFTSPYA